MGKQLSVVIVTYNSQRTIQDCLDSILENCQGVELIVVDNNSQDETIKIVKTYGNQVSLIEAGINLGFAKANNLGAKKALGDYLVFLNPDTKILKKGDLDELAGKLIKNPEYGLLGPKLVYPDSSLQPRTRNLPTLERAFQEYVLGKFGMYDFFQPDCLDLCEVESLIGACMVIKSDLFWKAGGFNEKYFMYYEDLELCREVRRLGFKVGFEPSVTVEHAEGVSGGNSKTGDFLQASAKQYHGYFNYLLIQVVIMLAHILHKDKLKVMLVLLLLFMAAVFRLTNLDLIEFKKDEATTVYQTVEFYKSPYLIPRGLISGIGVYNFPLFNYLMILFAVFSKDPLYLSALIALINVGLAGAFYLLVRKYYGNLTGILAGLLLAFSPWSIMFSRKIWAQDLILLILVPLLWLLHSLILKKNTKTIFWIFLLLTILGQLHGSGLFFVSATILITLVLRVTVKMNLLRALLGIAVGLIPAMPYLIFQISAHPFCPDCQSFMKYQSSIRSYDLYNFIRPFQSLFGLGYHFVLGDDYSDFITRFPLINNLKYLYLSTIIIPISGVYYILIKKRELVFILLYLSIIPILYFITKTESYMHYFMTLLPLMVILFAVSFNYLYNCFRPPILKTTVILYFISLILANAVFITSFYQYLAMKQNIAGDYGPVYSLTKERGGWKLDFKP